MKEEMRNSNHELMRIISMFLIVLGHVIIFGNTLSNTQNAGVKPIIMLWEFMLLMHVNSFVLLTGYYQSKKSFKQSTLWKLINQTLFYKILIIVVLTIMGLTSLDKLTILKELFPINMTQYWFIKFYFILYCISPFLNKLINTLNKRDFLKLLLVGFVVFSLIPSITHQGAFSNNGYTLCNFIYLYFLGAYLREYPLDKSYIFEPFSKKAYQIALIIIFILCFSTRYVIYYYADSIVNINNIYTDISVNIKTTLDHYSSPLLLLQSITYFTFFTSLSFKSKIINKLSPLVIGVYLIHANSYIRPFIFKWVGIDKPSSTYLYLINILIASLIIYVVCSLIEFIRQVIFKFIYDRKISAKIRDKYYSFIKDIYIKE